MYIHHNYPKIYLQIQMHTKYIYRYKYTHMQIYIHIHSYFSVVQTLNIFSFPIKFYILYIVWYIVSYLYILFILILCSSEFFRADYVISFPKLNSSIINSRDLAVFSVVRNILVTWILRNTQWPEGLHSSIFIVTFFHPNMFPIPGFIY